MQVNQGDIVTLKHYTGKNHSIGIVLEVENNIVKVRPSAECAVFSYFSNDPLVLGFMKLGKLNLSECTILSINYNENTVEFQIDKTYEFEEKRTTERFPTSLYGVIVRSQIKGAVYIKNISSDGLAIKTKVDLNKGDVIEIETYVNKILLTIKTSIMWKKPLNTDFEYGLQIINVEETQTEVLINYLNWLQNMQKEVIAQLTDSLTLSSIL